MRTQWCREHVDELVEYCGMGKAEATKTKKAAAFCDKHPAFMDCATSTIAEIIAITDPYVCKKTLLEAERILRVKKPHSSEFLKKKFSVYEIRSIIDKYKAESPNGKIRTKALEKQAKPNYLKVQVSLEQNERVVVENLIKRGYATSNSDALRVAIKWAATKIGM
jgi:hypothetical protein